MEQNFTDYMLSQEFVNINSSNLKNIIKQFNYMKILDFTKWIVRENFD